jgi:glutamyl-tRNA reductase|tara:strand:+ start:2322 stop:3578 length:1257 start_codon:yes stop_codon:yes gene_type:complete
MKENIINARVTFRKSPIHVLERFSFSDVDEAYSSFKKHAELRECVILQTCNRIEIFATGDEKDFDQIKKTWASIAGLEENAFIDNCEVSVNTEVYDHLLKLTSGLDSMVIGEEQILGQIKNSITFARNAKTSGEHLNTLFDKAIRVGTRVRNSTGISKGSISVGSMAVKLAEENVDEMKLKQILLIGTGEAAALVAKSLNKRGYQFSISSRTLERSTSFSKTVGGNPVDFNEILNDFGKYDIVFVATTAPYFLVTHERIKVALNQKHHGMMILDLSNPRTVDEKVAELSGIKLMNIDQIAEIVEKNMRTRIGQKNSAEEIIKEELPVLEASMKRLEAEPVVKDVFKNIDSLRIKELQKALNMLGSLDDDKKKIIDNLSKAIVESIVTTPMNNLRKHTEQGNTELLDAVEKLFEYKKDN